MEYRNRTAKGRVNVACLSFVSALKNKFYFMSTEMNEDNIFTLCFKRAFFNVLKGEAMKNFSAGKPLDPCLFLPVLEHIVFFALCNRGPTCLHFTAAVPYTRAKNNLVSIK